MLGNIVCILFRYYKQCRNSRIRQSLPGHRWSLCQRDGWGPKHGEEEGMWQCSHFHSHRKENHWREVWEKSSQRTVMEIKRKFESVTKRKCMEFCK